MSLTVKDILERTFKKSRRGYDEDEVDKFLDEIIDEFKIMQKDYASLKDDFDALKKKHEKVREAEETIMHTLVSAQKSSERILNEAARKAELILDNAENTARKRAEQTTKALQEAETRLQELKGNATSFAGRFTKMINEAASSFENTYQSYFGDGEISAGGINTEALERINKDLSSELKDIEPEYDPKPELEPEAMLETEPTAEIEAEPAADETEHREPDVVSDAEEDVAAPQSGKKGLMELHEINKALSDIEKGDDILQDSYEDLGPEEKDAAKEDSADADAYKPKYDDYSWLYETDAKQDNTEMNLKDPDNKDELKSLIDEIID